MDNTVKYCTDCSQLKFVTEFQVRSVCPDGLNTYCRPCKQARSNRWRNANKDKKAVYDKVYKTKYPERFTTEVRMKPKKTERKKGHTPEHRSFGHRVWFLLMLDWFGPPND